LNIKGEDDFNNKIIKSWALCKYMIFYKNTEEGMENK